MENIIFNLFTVIGFVVLYFTVKNLLPSYFNEKGKNLATKQDISEITASVESIKHSFTKETEKLKSNLQTITNIKVGLIEEEINSVVLYNEAYFQWLNFLIDTGFGGIDDRNDQELNEYLKYMNKAYSNFTNSETRLNLFVENRELITLANDLKIETLKRLATLAKKCILNFKHNNFSLKNISDDDYLTKHSTLLEKRTDYHKEFVDTMLTNYKTIVMLTHPFQKACRRHITELMSRQEEKIDH